ncbi:glycoside hydrolase family 2 TIM barrel-domain containing protein [Pedobacter sp. V48]|uniref:glycoside hydrolase family 2 TIM barrel-domain containing protein n=1 Tax=Pedobacter sp. V48 TaxID=509635 RepID=UPI0004B440B0|nr:glycoside hydrolase family 2 TIM barrel-domain containing protein [Pedobacter sp. V48]
MVNIFFKKGHLFLAFALTLGQQAAFAFKQGDGFLSKADTAFVPQEIQDPENLGINKEAAHATLMPYASLKEALAGNRHASSFSRSLNGTWKFNWVDWPQKRPVDFYKTDYDVSRWKNITVPSNWQTAGYGTPIYTNITYPFKKDFPWIMSTPPQKYTTYKQRNDVGSYRRDFTVPAEWAGRRVFITFDGVDAGFFIWVNGRKVGYSVNSRNAAEFDLTNYLRPGKNVLAVEVYRFTSASYFEDQDMWRLSGIFRNVTLWSVQQQHIRDYFIKTKLDAQYKNADVTVTTKVKNYSTSPTRARQVTVTLYHGTMPVAGSTGKSSVPALQPGEEANVTVKFHVANPQKWTAETPNLYTSIIMLKDGNKVMETLSSRTGFREIEIKARVFMINGVPVKLLGTNRHEHWPDVGHAVTEAQMLIELNLLKQGNCNHVRTCHYSDDPRWYELCDLYGIYLVAEANVECHGAMNQFNEEPRAKAAIIDRNVANVEGFKNHPSVIIWSLGNENGSGGTNFRAALNVVRGLDPSRPTHYEGFGTGDSKNPADMDSEMYTGFAALDKRANDPALTKPFYICEYEHSRFSSMGSLDLYVEMFHKYPALLGGAIWEWADQGLYNYRDPKRKFTAFGGGFGDQPNDHYSPMNGTVFSDRTLKPHYAEMKHAYQWVVIKAKDLKTKLFTIKNRYEFIDLNGFTAKWEVSEDGIPLTSGSFNVGLISPGEEKDVQVSYKFTEKPGKEYFLKVSFGLAKDELWAKKGFELISQQFEITGPVRVSKEMVKGGSLTLNESPGNIQVKGDDFRLEFDKLKGTFIKIEQSGINILTEAGGPMLQLWRSPHIDDDVTWGYAKGWDKYGLRTITWVTDEVKSAKVSPNAIEIKANLTGAGKEGFKVHHKVTYTITADGVINAANDISFESDPKLVLGRIGVRLLLDKSLEQFDYLGRGPLETYNNRKGGFDIAHYHSKVSDQLTPYEKPMESGNHEDVRWANLATAKGLGIHITHVDSLLQIAAVPYTDEETEPVEYKMDLPESKHTALFINHKTLGIASRGPVLEPFLVYARPTTFNYQLRLHKNLTPVDKNDILKAKFNR